MIIREFRYSDFPKILEIEKLSFEYPWSPYVFIRVKRLGAKFLVAEVEGEVVGFAIYRIERSLNIVGHLLNIAVHPNYRGRGIGSALLRQFEKEALDRGATHVYLEVRRSNVRAQRFYLRWGYRVVGVKEAYYSNGEDALIMAKELISSGNTSFSTGKKGK